MSCALASCSSDGETSADRPRQDLEPAVVATDDPALTQVASSEVRVPDWLPARLPVPEGAVLTEVGASACTVNFLVPANDAQVTGAAVGTTARGNGLEVDLVSSTSESIPGPQPEVEPGLFEEELPVDPVITLVDVLRIQGAADKSKGAAIDATLTLTSRGDGVVTGEYALAESTCAP